MSVVDAVTGERRWKLAAAWRLLTPFGGMKTPTGLDRGKTPVSAERGCDGWPARPVTHPLSQSHNNGKSVLRREPRQQLERTSLWAGGRLPSSDTHPPDDRPLA